MLELLASLKVVSGRQQYHAVCPTVKYIPYILRVGQDDTAVDGTRKHEYHL